MQNTIIHIATEEYILGSNYITNAKLLDDFSKENKMHNIVFYQGENEPPILLNYPTVEIHNYKTKKELLQRLKLIGKNEKIIFINTFQEKLVLEINSLRKDLGQKVTDNCDIFKDKGIFRELLMKNDPEVSVKFLKQKYSDLEFKKIKEEIGLPFIVKPLNGSASVGVGKIKNEKQFDKYMENYKQGNEVIKGKGYGERDEVMIEEYIDGDLYTIDYYVNEEGKTFISKPILEKDGHDLGFDDFFVFSRVLSKEVEDNVNLVELKKFIDRTIKAAGIRNTYINHEFKINKKGEFKNIEINGRIGWRRNQLYLLAYNKHLFSLLISKRPNFVIDKATSLLRMYSCKHGILKEYNEKLLEKISELDSFDKYDIFENLIGKEVGLSKDGYPFIGSIFLVNKNEKKLDNDIKFIEKKFCDFVELD